MYFLLPLSHSTLSKFHSHEWSLICHNLLKSYKSLFNNDYSINIYERIVKVIVKVIENLLKHQKNGAQDPRAEPLAPDPREGLWTLDFRDPNPRTIGQDPRAQSLWHEPG